MQNWDCSQIEDREEEEVVDWQEEDQMEEQCDEDDKLEEILERRRVDGGSLQAEVTQKVLELVAHEHMSQDKTVQGSEEKKKVKGWPTEEMKNKTSSSLAEDTEEMIGWRSMRQEEMDECWTKLAGKNE